MAGLTLNAVALIAYEIVEPVTESLARSTGELRRRTRGSETIDASIAVGVRHRRDAVLTSDPDDMRRLLGPAFIILAV